MAFTTTQLGALEEAIALGVLTVEWDGKRKTYRSLDEMLRLRDVMRRALGITDGAAMRIKAGFSKGLD